MIYAMKKNILILLMACGLGVSSCTDLDISPLSMATDENWFTTEAQFEMSVRFVRATSGSS